MPIECSFCPHLNSQYHNGYTLHRCTLVDVLVRIDMGKCELLDSEGKFKQIPLEQRKWYVRTKGDGTMESTLNGVDLNTLPSIGEFITSSKRWECTHKDVLNLVIVIESFVETTTTYGDALIADIIVNGESKTCLIGGKVLIQQLSEAGPHLPCKACITKVGRYYAFTEPREPIVGEDNPEVPF